MREAADVLGVSKEAIRKRVVRGTLPSEMGEDGRRYVYLDTEGDEVTDEGPTRERDVLISEMVEELRDEVHYLREQLHQELERRSAEAERYQQIVAALTTANASLTERLDKALEPPREPAPDEQESPESPDPSGPAPTTPEATGEPEGEEPMPSQAQRTQAGGQPAGGEPSEAGWDNTQPSEVGGATSPTVRSWWRRWFGSPPRSGE